MSNPMGTVSLESAMSSPLCFPSTKYVNGGFPPCICLQPLTKMIGLSSAIAQLFPLYRRINPCDWLLTITFAVLDLANVLLVVFDVGLGLRATAAFPGVVLDVEGALAVLFAQLDGGSLGPLAQHGLGESQAEHGCEQSGFQEHFRTWLCCEVLRQIDEVVMRVKRGSTSSIYASLDRASDYLKLWGNGGRRQKCPIATAFTYTASGNRLPFC